MHLYGIDLFFPDDSRNIISVVVHLLEYILGAKQKSQKALLRVIPKGSAENHQ